MGAQPSVNGHDEGTPISQTESNAEADGGGTIDAAEPSPAPSQAAASDDGASSRAEQPTEVTVRFRLVCGGLTQARVPVAIAARYDGLPLAAATRAFDGILDSWLNRAIDLGIIGSGLGQLFPIDVQALDRKSGV